MSLSLQSILERARGILLTPRETWPAIAAEPVTTHAVFSGWIVWFAAIGPVAHLIGATAFGSWSAFPGGAYLSLGHSIVLAALSYVLALVMAFLMAFIVQLLAPNFGGTRNYSQAIKTVAYAYTPAWIVAVLGVIPSGGWLVPLSGLLAAGYALYLLYTGLPYTMCCPPARSGAYAVVSVVIAVILSVGLSAAIVAPVAMLTLRSTGIVSPLPWSSGTGSGSHRTSTTVPAWGEGGYGPAPGAAADRRTVSAVPVDRLKQFLPRVLNGYARSHLTANQIAVGSEQYSEVEAIYRSSTGRTVDLKVEDLGSMRFMATIAADTQFETQSSRGYNRNRIIGGMPVSERWYAPTQSGRYVVYVARRFLVQAKGSPTSMPVLQAFVRAVDLQGLAALK